MTIIDKQNTTGGQGGSSSQEHGAGVVIMAEQMMQEAAGKTIPAGYKQTEVGVIPEDWEVVTVNSLISGITSGVSVNSIDKIDAFSHGLHVLKTSCVSEGRFFPEERKSILPSDINRAKCSPMKGDIIVSRMNTPLLVGELGYVPFDMETSFLPDRLWLMKFNSVGVVDSRWLCRLLSSSEYANKIKESATGTSGSMKNISKDSFLSMLVSKPVFEEQTAIANVLSDSDALIDALEQLIAKKQAIKSATMQQLLTGRTRLPAFALRPDGTPKGYKPSELGDIPEDWEVVSLGDASQFINGRAYALHEWESSGVPVIRLQNLTGRGDEYYYSNLQLPERQYCYFGDLLFMWSATFGPVIWKGSKAIYHYHIWKIECKSGNNKTFLFYLLGDMTERLKNSSSSGGTMLHVTKEKMESTKSIFPSIEEQTAIATILSDMDNELQALIQKLEKARALKQGMMQQLLTGKIRLPLTAGA
ncbi:restriction endonuclease subunit S [Aeromonas caviae]|uniref:restriction endonuclease subunit S n=1 Tax=Aeromonas caviae TaxID=648 RepID=UPI00214EBEB8|nr:restriction endonuclease subunit S [Aeromonas caviae]MCR3894765.1 restriction endonuclease subunit S [Aeromonas caviae]